MMWFQILEATVALVVSAGSFFFLMAMVAVFNKISGAE